MFRQLIGRKDRGRTLDARPRVSHADDYAAGHVAIGDAALTDYDDCDRTVIRQAEDLGEHRGLGTHTE